MHFFTVLSKSLYPILSAVCHREFYRLNFFEHSFCLKACVFPTSCICLLLLGRTTVKLMGHSSSLLSCLSCFFHCCFSVPFCEFSETFCSCYSSYIIVHCFCCWYLGVCVLVVNLPDKLSDFSSPCLFNFSFGRSFWNYCFAFPQQKSFLVD